MSNEIVGPSHGLQRQPDAYNAKNIEALLATNFAPAEQVVLNGDRVALGYEEIHEQMLLRFTEPGFCAQLMGVFCHASSSFGGVSLRSASGRSGHVGCNRGQIDYRGG